MPLKAALLLASMLAQAHFQVVGDVVTDSVHRLERAEIESIDRRFVDYTDIDADGKFVFKNVPEGLYKVMVSFDGGLDEQRSIEVRSSLADQRGRVPVQIEIKNTSAEEQFTVSVANLSVSPKAIDELRRASEAKGDVEEARRHLEKAIEISPNFEEALNNLGTYYYRDGLFDKAASLFERAVRANPNSFVAQVNLGGALVSLGDYQRAVAENAKALSMRPDSSLALSQMGQALFHLMRYDEALPHLEKAQRIDPASFTLPGIFIAQIYEIQGRKDAAIAEYKEFLRVHPGHPDSAVVEHRLGELERESK